MLVISEVCCGNACEMNVFLFADELKQLISAADECYVNFVYALSPGLDVVYTSTTDIAALKAKLDQVSDCVSAVIAVITLSALIDMLMC